MQRRPPVPEPPWDRTRSDGDSPVPRTCGAPLCPRLGGGPQVPGAEPTAAAAPLERPLHRAQFCKNPLCAQRPKHRGRGGAATPALGQG